MAVDPQPECGVIYHIDASDRIVRVNQAWNEFALGNGGAHLAGDRVLGQPLWHFITGVTTRRIYRSMIEGARQGRLVRFDFRCDAPSMRRVMRMRIAAAGDGLIEFQARFCSMLRRMPQNLLNAEAPRVYPAMRICSWCKRVLAGDRWCDIDELPLVGRSLGPCPPPLIHSICPRCLTAMVRITAALG